MQFDKKILAITLGISFHGAAIGMLQENTSEGFTLNIPCNNMMQKKLWDQLNVHMEYVEKEAENQGNDLANLIVFSDSIKRDNVVPLATWLIQQKNSFPDKQWHQIIEKLSSSILMYSHDNHPKSEKFETAKHIITKTAYNLKSDEDCPQTLALQIVQELYNSQKNS